MQLPLSAGVLVPIGVGVLVAVVAVIVLVTGLRRRADDVSVPTDDDWTGERVGEAVAAPTRTVADAVAARQSNSDPFLVVSPAQPRTEEAGERNGTTRVVPLGAVVSGVSASVPGVEHARHAAPGGARTAVVGADAAPAEGAAPVAVADTPQPTGATAPRGATNSAAEGRPAFPADPLFGAGRFDQVGPDGDPWFTPPSLPRTPPVAAEKTPVDGNLESDEADSAPKAAWPFDQRPASEGAAPAAPRAAASESAVTTGVAGGTEPEPPAARPIDRPADGASAAAEAAPPGAPHPTASPSNIPHPATAQSATTPAAPHAAASPSTIPHPATPGSATAPAAPAEVLPPAASDAATTAARALSDTPHLATGGGGAAAGPAAPSSSLHPADRDNAVVSAPTSPSGAAAATSPPSPVHPVVGGSAAAAIDVSTGARPATEQSSAAPFGVPHPAMGGSASHPGAVPSGALQRVTGNVPQAAVPPGAPHGAGDPSAASQAPAGSSGVRHPAAGGSVPAPAPAAPSDAPHPTTGGAPTPAIPVRSADGHPVEAGPAAGSSHSVAAAVAQVLAARAAAQAPDADRRGDARDRLLSVLLDDPLRAVGAAVDLQDCQERIDRLTATLGDERGRLGDVLGRLACSGLRADQLARLSGLADHEVADLLRRASDA